eukprot:scaffold18862_cov129-Skeletonema_dohrnii-CCMP3373.AAC.1
MARRKCSIRISVFFTSELKTSEPTIGQNGTFGPSSWATPNANAVFPVPGAPANKSARPAILRDRIKSTMRPHASRACSWPTKPDPMGFATPVCGSRPNPLM